MYKIANEEAPDLLAVRPDLPQQLAQVLARAMAKKPEQRFQDGDQLALELRAALAPLAAGAVQPIVTSGADKTQALRQPPAGEDADKTVVMAFNNGPGTAFAATLPASALPGYDAGQKDRAAPQFDQTSVMDRPGGQPRDDSGKTGQEP
jgi:serine/threonine-protein kinase